MRFPMVILAALLLAGLSAAQAANDSCATAYYLVLGAPTSGTNVGATSGPDPVATCGSMGKDVWFVFVPNCTGIYTATTCDPATTYDSAIAAWDGTNGCGPALVPLGCNDDGCSNPGASSLTSTLSFAVTAGNVYYVSVGGYQSASGSFVLTVGPGGGTGMTLAFSNLGPATIGFTVDGGPAGGTALTIVTLNQGLYPNGWLFGIDVQPFELQFSLGAGYPLTAQLDLCGSFAFGPIGGAPPGIGVYAVSFGIPAGTAVPNVHSAPASIIIP